MTGTIFDLIEKEPAHGQEGYFEAAKNAPKPKEKSFLNDVSDYAKTFLKGTVEGVSALGQLMGPSNPAEPHEEQQRKQTETLDILLPTDENYSQKAIRRGLKQAPSAVAFPGSVIQSLPRAIAAGFTGEGAKELGLPEWAQTAAELTAYIGPDITKKLLEKGEDKALIAQARKLGISDDALAPLLQSEFKQKWLTKLTPRRGQTQKILSQSKEELGEAYGTLQKSEQAAKEIGDKAGLNLIEKFDEILFEMPSGVREKISRDLKDFYGKPITGDSLINLWKDINHEMGGNSKQLSLLKEPIRKALKETSPELAKNFDVINDLFGRYYKISKRLEPNLMTDIIGASEALAIVTSLTTGYYPIFLKFAGEKTARKIAQNLLLKPRFQQISHKMADALMENKFSIAKKLSDLMAHELREYSPEMAEKLENISEEDLMSMIKNHHKKS